MKYFFILGKNPTLSTAEISTVFPEASSGQIISEQIFLLETANKINPDIIKKLGGTIKIGILNFELKIENNEKLLGEIIKLIDIKKINGKFKFGISCYAMKKFNIKPLGMEIKKYLKNKGASCRWVTSREPTLSSVVVEQNKLVKTRLNALQRGIEIVLIKQKNKILIGRTLTVQPFKELSFRDYGRPARDDRSGMLPPKLAQIMINLAAAPLLAENGGEAGFKILDPFCGSGTILTEALLMGYKDIVGSDISEKAVNNTKKNIEWTKTKFPASLCGQGGQISNFEFQIYNKNTTELSKFIKPKSIDAIITEPYLGPQRGKIDIKKVKKELENLYSKSLAEFKKILKPGGRVVMVFPVFHAFHGARFISPNLNGFKIVNPILPGLRENAIIKLTDKKTIIYGREGQRVWREIVILEAIYPQTNP